MLFHRDGETPAKARPGKGRVFPKAIDELHGHSGIARLALFYAIGLTRYTRDTLEMQGQE